MTRDRLARGSVSLVAALVVALVVALASACAPTLAGGGDEEVLDVGPLRLILELPTRQGLSPLEDADELVVTVRDRKGDREAVARLRVEDAEDRAIDDVPWGDDMLVTVEARSTAFNLVTGHARAEGVTIGGDSELRLRLLRRLAYANDPSWQDGRGGGAIWVADLGVATDDGEVLVAPMVDRKEDQQRPRDLYLTRDARVLVSACIDFNEPDPDNPALGRLRIYDTRTNDLIEDDDVARSDIDLPLPLSFARPIGDGYRVAGVTDEAPTLFVVDLKSGDVATHALVPGNPAQWDVRAAVTAADDALLYVSAQVNDEPRLLRVDLRKDPPEVTSHSPGAGLEDAEARGLSLSDNEDDVRWALARHDGVIDDGDAIWQSAVEVRSGRALEVDRTILLPPDDFNLGALVRLPDDRIGAATQLIDRTPDDCCTGAVILDDDDEAPVPELLPLGFGASVLTHDGDAIVSLNAHGNEQFQLVWFPRDADAAPKPIRPDGEGYWDTSNAVAVPYGW